MLTFDRSILGLGKKELLIRSVFVFLATVLVAFAIVLNKNANLGNDAVAIFYDGIHKLFNISFGTATNLVSVILLVFLLFFASKNINIGTLMHTLPLGAIINFFEKIVTSINLPDILILNILKSICGCLTLFLGIALFISANIGVDVWTAFVLFLKEKFNKEYRFIKVCLDTTLTVLGFLMGGKLGVLTIAAALCGGPLIQSFTKITDRIVKQATK